MRSVLRILGVVVIALILVLGTYGAAAYLGWRTGQRQRNEQAALEQSAEIVRQVELARTDIGNGSHRLALRRLEWVLAQEPASEAARALQAEAQQQLSASPAATPILAATSTAEATSTVAPDSAPDSEPAQRVRQLELLTSGEDWEEAIPALIAFQQEYPEFQRRTTDNLLFVSYVTYGTELLYTNRAELGLFYLRQAETLGDLPQEAADQRQWAQLYLAGISFYSVNWDAAIFYFRELCLSAPFFHDACSRLESALSTSADQFISIQEWCPAVPLLQEAYGLSNNQGVANKLAAARSGCASATPTSSAPLSGTSPITGTVPLTGTLPGPPVIIEGP